MTLFRVAKEYETQRRKQTCVYKWGRTQSEETAMEDRHNLLVNRLSNFGNSRFHKAPGICSVIMEKTKLAKGLFLFLLGLLVGLYTADTFHSAINKQEQRLVNPERQQDKSQYEILFEKIDPDQRDQYVYRLNEIATELRKSPNKETN